MILITSFYLIYFNLSNDFVLTTLATRKQSHIFPQHIGPETPLQHVCDFLFLRKMLFSITFAELFCQKRKSFLKKC